MQAVSRRVAARRALVVSYDQSGKRCYDRCSPLGGLPAHERNGRHVTGLSTVRQSLKDNDVLTVRNTKAPCDTLTKRGVALGFGAFLRSITGEGAPGVAYGRSGKTDGNVRKSRVVVRKRRVVLRALDRGYTGLAMSQGRKSSEPILAFFCSEILAVGL